MSERSPVAHKPYVDPGTKMPEFTLLPLVAGIVLGIVFGASSLYLALKVGMTVSASIPIAVLAITIFRGLSHAFGLRRATILENNLVQTTGSAGESIAFGVAVTMPALMILGHDMELGRVMIVATLGGLLGVLMMIPLRRALIVQEHGNLKYPEGTACAQVLIVGEQGGTNAKTVFAGFGVGFFYKVLMAGMHFWKEIPEKLLFTKSVNPLSPLTPAKVTGWNGAALSCEVTPELLGVGYIIGPRIASIMVAGGILSSLVLIPAIKLFGSTAIVLFPGTKPIADMSPMEVWRSYVLYIGAGAVAAGGIISLLRALPTIVSGARSGMRGLSAAAKGMGVLRTERDIPMKWVLWGMVGLVLAIWAAPMLHMNLVGAILIVVFGFLFVTVSSRLTGEIGSSSNPISGMTVATLLVTCLVFLALGWTTPVDRVTALSVAAVVCIAASNGGTTSQDLKTGFLVGATPSWQQVGLLIGAVTSALVIGYTLLVLNSASTVYAGRDFPGYVAEPSLLGKEMRLSGPDAKKDANTYRVLQLPLGAESAGVKIPPGKYLADVNGKIHYLVDPGINGAIDRRDDGTRVAKYEAPKARLMSLIIDGILTRKLPWGLVLLGVFLSIVLELCGVSSLPFAVGVYLPLSSSSPIFVGGLARWLVDRRVKYASEDEAESSPGVLASSGLIAGGAIAGIGIALLALREDWAEALSKMSSVVGALALSDLFALGMFGLLFAFLYSTGRSWLLGKARIG